MSLAIATDMYLLCSLFNINYRKITNEYQGMTIEQIMEAEAAQGNSAAANFDATILSDPIKLIELFKLNNAGNKYSILHYMNENDLVRLLPLLEQNDLVQGLNFFTKDKLLIMIGELPKDQIIKFTQQMFSQEQIIQYLPEDQINKMLQSTDMDKDQELKYLKSINPQVLAFMMESVTGQPASGVGDVGLNGQPKQIDGDTVYNQLASLPDDKFQEAMLAMPKQHKRDFVLQLAKNNPKLYLSVDSDAYTKMIGQRKDKSDIVKAATVIDHDNLVKMIAKLPKDLMAVVLTQIDTKKFADQLLAKFKNIIKDIVAA